jgi:hypothetical protein
MRTERIIGSLLSDTVYEPEAYPCFFFLHNGYLACVFDNTNTDKCNDRHVQLIIILLDLYIKIKTQYVSHSNFFLCSHQINSYP